MKTTYLSVVLLCTSSTTTTSDAALYHGKHVVRMSLSPGGPFDQPVRIGYDAQRRMLSRGFSVAAAAAAAAAATVTTVAPALAASSAAAVGLCSSCGSGKNSLSSLCNACATGARWYNPANERIFDTKRGSYLPPLPAKFLSKDRLDGRTIVVIGEVHSNPCHHRLEFDIIRALSSSGSDSNGVKLSIGLECFYRQNQAALDRFVFEHKDFLTLKRETSWDQNWGYDLNFYAKIFQFAAMNGIRLVGLNVPFPVAQLVGRVGLSQIPSELHQLLPDVDLGTCGMAWFCALIPCPSLIRHHPDPSPNPS